MGNVVHDNVSNVKWEADITAESSHVLTLDPDTVGGVFEGAVLDFHVHHIFVGCVLAQAADANANMPWPGPQTMLEMEMLELPGPMEMEEDSPRHSAKFMEVYLLFLLFMIHCLAFEKACLKRIGLTAKKRWLHPSCVAIQLDFAVLPSIKQHPHTASEQSLRACLALRSDFVLPATGLPPNDAHAFYLRNKGPNGP
ncbi:hypothetical protein ACLOJK_035776 [Asimina triloba]